MTTAPPVTYAGYLQLERILGAQRPLSPEPPGSSTFAAEHFFIVVHQAFELWFSQELLDLECAARLLAGGPSGVEAALGHLRRVVSIQRLLTQQMVLFDDLSPQSFLAFRSYLGTASGSESAQFRAVQKALGLRGKMGSPVYQAFTQALGLASVSLEDLYRDPMRHGALYRVAEALVDVSEGFWQLSAAHVQIVERTIGHKPGTGGTSGADYLADSLRVKAFPDLWDVRTRL